MNKMRLKREAKERQAYKKFIDNAYGDFIKSGDAEEFHELANAICFWYNRPRLPPMSNRALLRQEPATHDSAISKPSPSKGAGSKAAKVSVVKKAVPIRSSKRLRASGANPFRKQARVARFSSSMDQNAILLTEMANTAARTKNPPNLSLKSLAVGSRKAGDRPSKTARASRPGMSHEDKIKAVIVAASSDKPENIPIQRKEIGMCRPEKDALEDGQEVLTHVDFNDMAFFPSEFMSQAFHIDPDSTRLVRIKANVEKSPTLMWILDTESDFYCPEKIGGHGLIVSDRQLLDDRAPTPVFIGEILLKKVQGVPWGKHIVKVRKFFYAGHYSIESIPQETLQKSNFFENLATKRYNLRYSQVKARANLLHKPMVTENLLNRATILSDMKSENGLAPKEPRYVQRLVFRNFDGQFHETLINAYESFKAKA